MNTEMMGVGCFFLILVGWEFFLSRGKRTDAAGVDKRKIGSKMKE